MISVFFGKSIFICFFFCSSQAVQDENLENLEQRQEAILTKLKDLKDRMAALQLQKGVTSHGINESFLHNKVCQIK